jgi:hypothetical protein
MFNAKLEVITLFLAFISRYFPLTHARLATLGGEGLEASAWEEKGITRAQGWLIECAEKKSRRLLNRFPYNVCAQLADFARGVQSVEGNNYAIDGFHLDLCGTLEHYGPTFAPCIPLIARSTGKCLAVTVADQRRNVTLENFGSVYTDAIKLFGGSAQADAFQKRLRDDYDTLPDHGIGLWAQPQNGAEREFGFAFHILSAFAADGGVTVDRIERYLYTSTHRGRPFRMRTYFFHLRKGEISASEILALWSNAPLQCITAQGIITINEKEPIKMAYPNLTKLVETLGGVYLEEFKSVIKDANYGLQVRLIPYNGSIAAPIAAMPTQVLAQPKAVVTTPVKAIKQKPSARSARKAPAKPTRDGVSKTNRNDILAVQLDMVRAMPRGKEAIAGAMQAGAMKLGYDGHNMKRRMVRTFARTQGKHRPPFLKSLASAGMLSEKVAEELASIYKVPVTEMRSEAGL